MKIAVATETTLWNELQACVEESGHEARRFDSLSQALATRPQLVFAQWSEGKRLPDLLRGLEAAARAENPIPVVVLVPSGGLAAMRRARAAGAADVLFGTPDPQEILAEIDQVTSDAYLPRGAERSCFERIVEQTLVGESPNFKRCLNEMVLAGRCDANVLLLGETGTGKEALAKGVHALSRRSGNPYVIVNCPAVSANLLESEFFGHAKGAFTDAKADRRGRFEEAGAGTLFLDEIGYVPLELQVKLLRAIEQRVFQRVGENNDIRCQARLICATAVDLDRAAAEGRFRRDLLGRIDQFRITLPPLRERRVDIPILTRHFLRKHAQGRSAQLSRSAADLLDSCPFTMNVRQLENAIVAALARSDPGSVILPKHLPKEIMAAGLPTADDNADTIQIPSGLSYTEIREHVCRTVDRKYLVPLSRRHGGNETQTSKEAGIDRKTLKARLTALLPDPEEERNA